MSNKYKPGTKVSHAIFGVGEVKDSKPQGENYRLDIEFKDGTSKTLLSTFIEIVSDDSTEEDDGENEVVEAEQGPHIDKIRQAAPQTLVPSVPSDSSMGKLEKLIKRRNAGEVTSEEFEEMKKDILKRKPQVSKDSIEIVQEGIHSDDVPRKENKDGVVSKSNDVTGARVQTVDPDWVVNSGTSDDDKFAKLDRLAEIKEKGLIDDDEFKQMKKEILGK